MVLRVGVRPVSPLRLGAVSRGMDGLMRRRPLASGGAAVLERLLHLDQEPVVVRAAQRADGTVLIDAQAATERAAEHGIARMRFALGVDDDLSEFLARFARDPLIGPSVRRRPWLRVRRRPDPFEALVWAICEQLIEYERAAAIQRRIVWRLGRSAHGLRDLPSARSLADTAPAALQALDLSGGRSIALVRAAREVADGRVDLMDSDHERGWRRLLAVREIGRWTVQTLALHGQGRHDQLPAGDLTYIKLVGRLRGGDPRARASEDEVRDFFAPYGEWAGLAAAHLCAAVRSPAPAGTRL